MKLVRGELGEAAASVCHERELDAEREVGERLELVIAGWYDLLALFPAVAEERRIVADQDNHGDALAELRQNLLDEPRVGLVEADVNGGKQPVMRREFRASASLRVQHKHGETGQRQGPRSSQHCRRASLHYRASVRTGHPGDQQRQLWPACPRSPGQALRCGLSLRGGPSTVRPP